MVTNLRPAVRVTRSPRDPLRALADPVPVDRRPAGHRLVPGALAGPAGLGPTVGFSELCQRVAAAGASSDHVVGQGEGLDSANAVERELDGVASTAS